MSTQPPTLLLIHGAWHDASCWAALLPLLRERGLRVIATDLPGHGKDPLPLAKVTMKAYVAHVLELLDAQPGPCILLGHSMAGMVVSAAAAQRPHKVEQLVYLCAYLPRDGESLFDLLALNRQGEETTEIERALRPSPDKRSYAVTEEAIIPLFYTLAPESIALQVKAAFGVQATLPLNTRIRLPAETFRDIPRSYICCTRDRVIPLRHQHRMLARQPCSTLLQIEADHSPFLSCPGQLAALLEIVASCPTASGQRS